jgi:hypothetical protein
VDLHHLLLAGLPAHLCENSKVRSATRMIFSSSILKLNALAMWAPKTAFNEKLVLSRLIAFAFSHSLGQQATSRAWPNMTEPPTNAAPNECSV